MSFKTSTACRLPMTPQIAPSTPASGTVGDAAAGGWRGVEAAVARTTRRGEVEGGGEPALTLDADFPEQNVPAVARAFGGRERGQGVGHSGERERLRGAPQMKLRPRRRAAEIRRMRCLGIDYGTRRIGLAGGDDLGLATPLPALTQTDEGARWAGLIAVVKVRRPTDLVLGYPFNMDGSAGFKAKEVEAFAARLRAEFRLPVHFVDERLTSYEAEGTIAKSKRREVRASGVVDSRAAAIILQDFLNQKNPPLAPPPDGESE